MSFRKPLLVLSAAGLAALPLAAQAAGGGAEPGVYFSVGAGFTSPDTTDQKTVIAPFSGGNTLTIPSGFDTEFDDGFHVGGAIGYQMNAYWRLEGELRYSSADIDATVAKGAFNVPTPTNPAGTLTPNSGDVSVTALFGNAILDITTGGRTTPYLGAGLGYADVDISGIGSDSGEGVFAYQLFVGADMSLDKKSWIGARASFMDTDDFAYDPVGLSTVGGAFTLGDAQYSAFDVTISYRRKLN